MFYGFPVVKTVANGRAASASAEHPVIHRTIAQKQTKTTILKFCCFIGKNMEIRYKETNLYIFIAEMKFHQVHSYKTSRWGHVCSLGAKWRRPIHDVKKFILYLLDYYKSWMPPFCTQGTHVPSSRSFLTKYLAELHFVFCEIRP